MPKPRPWHLLFVLPNLELPDPVPTHEQNTEEQGKWLNGITLGSQYLAIVSPNDSRVREIAKGSAAAGKLLASFRRSNDTQYHPAVLIENSTAPRELKNDLAAVVDFRNAVAFSFLLRARAAAATDSGGAEPTWSDTFDFHPTVVSANDRLVTVSEALKALYSENAKHLATQSPHLSPAGERLYGDHFLMRALGDQWRRYYETGGRRFAKTQALFRSLQMAYQASSVALKNQGSVYEYGLQMALWVSAFEILAWPKTGRANLQQVVNLIGLQQWRDPELRAQRYRYRHRGQHLRLNVAQRAYTLIYIARNRFLHGEPVSPRLLLPKRYRGTVARLPRLASSPVGTLGGGASVVPRDGPSFIAVPEVGGAGLVAQAHGGALKRGNPGNTGHIVAAERRRARAERSEAVDDAMVGHVEKMSGTIAQLVEEAGEQYRCPQCGSFGPKVSDH